MPIEGFEFFLSSVENFSLKKEFLLKQQKSLHFLLIPMLVLSGIY